MQYLYKILKLIFVFFEPNAYIQHLLSLKALFPNGLHCSLLFQQDGVEWGTREGVSGGWVCVCYSHMCVIMLNMTLKLLTSLQPTRLKRRGCFWYPSEDEQSRATRDNISKSEPSLVKHLTLLKDLDSFLAIWPKSNKMRRETLDDENMM